ncbi:MAG: tetratricopeptide repeat protein [Kiloniellales bacterium]|nr:tetratricopeptide repeat protein [Kiloniellales bacterium]
MKPARWALAALLLGASAAGAAEPSAYPDYGEGLRWHLNAAEAGDAEAQYRLARFYQAGIKAGRDPVEARRWYAAAAAQGHPQAAFRLAAMLQSGSGGPVDPTEARRWFEAAASLPLAQYNLASLLERGLGGPRDAARAAELYESAARAGVMEAATQLAVMKIDGRGLPEDRVGALAWLIVAAEAGTPGAEESRALLAGQLEPAERQQAGEQARTLRRR